MTNSKKKCKQCGEYVYVEKGLSVPAGFFCSFSHAREFARAVVEMRHRSQLVNTDKEVKANRQALRVYNKQDLAWQHRLTQKSFNRMRVLEELKWFADRDLEPECISCGKQLGGDRWCCGHFKTVGAQPGLRYDRRNAHLQHNYNCNMNLSGDIEGTKKTRGYKKGLVERFGKIEGQEILDYCHKNTEVVKWEWQSLEKFRAECNAKIRLLQSLY